MTKKKSLRNSVSTTLPKNVRGDILSLVEAGEFKSVSDFLRKAAFGLLDKLADEKGDILKEKKFKRFIEKIS
jgi:Arc/MetJ-type ribon-helix-helix transcriptional regulator